MNEALAAYSPRSVAQLRGDFELPCGAGETPAAWKDLHLIMGQKQLIWDRVWNVRSTRSNLYLHLIHSMYIYIYKHIARTGS